MLSPLATHLARAVVAVENARREAERAARDEKYELGYAAKWLRMATDKLREHDRVAPEEFQALADCARVGFEGMPS